MSALTISFPSEGRALVVWTTCITIVFLTHYGLTTDRMNFGRQPAVQSDTQNGSEAAGISKWWDNPKNFMYTLLARSACVAIILSVILRPFAYSALLGLFIGAGVGVWIWVRAGAKGYALLTTEIVGNMALLVITGLAITHTKLDFRFLVVRYATPDERIAVLLTAAAMLLYLGKGATYVVRGILEQAGTMPRFDSDAKTKDRGWIATADHLGFIDRWVISVEQIKEDAQDPRTADDATQSGIGAPDPKEYRRGKLIGNIERLVVAILASLGSYPAIAFVLTAKGLVRAKEFEDRDYAEYFLVGTLASCALALIAGILFRFIFDRLW
ncbi:MAG: hypothetical protein AVDCRST_MAG68-2666 [uncultured Gemmatimonadetes bacterium]|uniref:Uncharacterized protein n=1 Tax=uncultured Gemmatimonadota bacterium TaxID=203437 RepID=A0A6J4LLF0_9BACT|nr:MAG: hypothetical protein AVDCRST_MAG68-2666 [uncultured Gemmatimonadota bacterium]